MRKAIVAAVLLAAVAWGQDEQRTYHFARISTTRGYQEIVNVFRTAIELRDVAVDNSARTLSTHGTPDQMALADWLFPQLDVTGTPAPVTHEYQTTGTVPVIRVFYFAHAPTNAAAQEIVNVIRTGANVNRVIIAWESRSLTVRATADQVAAAAWMFAQLDVSERTPGAPTQSFHLPAVADSEMRIVHLSQINEPVAMQDLVNSLRIIGELNRVFPVNVADVVVMRGTPQAIATAEWLTAQLDVAPMHQGPAPHDLQVTDGDQRAPVAHVFYLTHSDSPQSIQEIVNAVRAGANVQHIDPNNQLKAVVLRGTADQVAQATTLIAQLDR